MNRPKPFLTYFILCSIPLLLLAGLNYWRGIRTVDSTISSIAQGDLNSFNVAIDELIRAQERALLSLAMSPDVQRSLADQNEANEGRLNSALDLSGYFRSVTLFNRDRQALSTRIALSQPAELPQPDQRIWGLHGNVLLDKPNSNPATLEYTAPVHGENGSTNVGALVGVLDLSSVFAGAAHSLVANNRLMVVVLDRGGKVIHQSDPTLVSGVPPGFEPVATAMTANQSGVSQFNLPTGSYVAAYSPIPRLNVAMAVARSRSEFISDAHRWGIATLVLALLAALIAAFVLERHVQRRSKGMARVTEDLSAIAKGELDRRIVLQSSDDARVIADNINVVTERLRGQIAREEESRQFESFVRLSAMLTHDLKNAIEGLSLTVGNMEKHFDNPQFRSDALRGLTSATDKLKAIVARLARPVMTLSGEHKRPTNVDLVPIIQRVVSMTAEPQRGKHKIVTRLPPSLFAFV